MAKRTKRSGKSGAAGGGGAVSAAPKVVKRRTLHKGRKFDFEIVTLKRPSGKTLVREVVRHPGAVVVVPLTDDGRVVMVRNYRFSVQEHLLECCAGTMEPPEPPRLCASRELIEETGYKAGKLVSLGWFYTTPGLTDEKMHAFFATGLKEVGQDLEEDETIEVELVHVEDVFRMIGRGEIRDGKTMTALLLARQRGLLGKAGGRS